MSTLPLHRVWRPLASKRSTGAVRAANQIYDPPARSNLYSRLVISGRWKVFRVVPGRAESLELPDELRKTVDEWAIPVRFSF